VSIFGHGVPGTGDAGGDADYTGIARAAAVNFAVRSGFEVAASGCRMAQPALGPAGAE